MCHPSAVDASKTRKPGGDGRLEEFMTGRRLTGGAMLCLMALLAGRGAFSSTETPSAPATPKGFVGGQAAAYGGFSNAYNGPLRNQPITLVDSDSHVIATTKTDSQGNYLLVAAAGTYRVTGDHCSQAVHVVHVKAATTQQLDLICQMR